MDGPNKDALAPQTTYKGAHGETPSIGGKGTVKSAFRSLDQLMKETNGGKVPLTTAISNHVKSPTVKNGS